MEKLLEKLGAEHSQLRHGYGWVLHRVNNYITLEADSTGIHVGEGGEWLLIGETTEALREKGWNHFQNTVCDNDAMLFLMNYNDDTRNPSYSGDTLLVCYKQAGEELL